MSYPISEVIMPVFGLAVMLCLWYYAYNLFGPLLFDYRFHHLAVDIVMFGGRVVIWKIDKIDSATIINVLNPISWLKHNPWLSVAIPNRLKLHYLVIRKGIWTVYLSPDNIKTSIETILYTD